MTHKTLQDYPDAQVDELQSLKTRLARGASRHKIRSVRTIVSQRYDVPALRIENKNRFMAVSAHDELDETGVEILTAFTTEDGNQVFVVGHKDGDTDE